MSHQMFLPVSYYNFTRPWYEPLLYNADLLWATHVHSISYNVSLFPSSFLWYTVCIQYTKYSTVYNTVHIYSYLSHWAYSGSLNFLVSFLQNSSGYFVFFKTFFYRKKNNFIKNLSSFEAFCIIIAIITVCTHHRASRQKSPWPFWSA